MTKATDNCEADKQALADKAVVDRDRENAARAEFRSVREKDVTWVDRNPDGQLRGRRDPAGPLNDMPRDGQIVIAQAKTTGPVVAQYRIDPTLLRAQEAKAAEAERLARRGRGPDRALDRDATVAVPAGPVIRGDFYAQHAGAPEYSSVLASVVAWAPMPETSQMIKVLTDAERADLAYDRGHDPLVHGLAVA